MERLHDLADVPHIFNPKFFPTDKEKEWAKKTRKKIKSRNIILWALIWFFSTQSISLD